MSSRLEIFAVEIANFRSEYHHDHTTAFYHESRQLNTMKPKTRVEIVRLFNFKIRNFNNTKIISSTFAHSGHNFSREAQHLFDLSRNSYHQGCFVRPDHNERHEGGKARCFL